MGWRSSLYRGRGCWELWGINVLCMTAVRGAIDGKQQRRMRPFSVGDPLLTAGPARWQLPAPLPEIDDGAEAIRAMGPF